jgi:hypothetical protein
MKILEHFSPAEGDVSHSLPARNEWGESRREGSVLAPPLPGPMASQARHQMDTPTIEIASRSVVLPPSSGGEGEHPSALEN